MKFVTDLSKGILGRPDSEELWNEIISYVPDEMLLKPDFRALVVACGHCTEAILLVKRMQSLGIPNSRIQDAIWVLDKYQVFTNQARCLGFKHVITADFLSWDAKGMKFDLVLGNPPYSNPKGNGSHPLYRSFIKKAVVHCSENGYVTIVSPPGFLNSSDAFAPSEVFSMLKKGDIFHIQLSGVNEKFPGIGTPICYFVWKNAHYRGETVIDGVVYDIANLSFIPRIFNTLVMNIIQKVIQNDTLQFSYRGKTDDSKWRVCFKELNHITSRKGNIVPTVISPGETNHCQFVRESSSEKEAINLKDYLTSKIVSFFNFVTRYNSVLHNRMIGRIQIPDLTRTWTDAELYSHFNLTQDEIDYIEANVA